jgi:ribosomal protein S18 acetylase RimI-like enzyme
MLAWGQASLFMIRPGEADLDARLAELGYLRRDPTLILAAPSDSLAGPADPEATVRCTAPVARMAEIWRDGGIGPARFAVMDRVPGARVWLLGRHGDRPVACAFLAAHGSAAMLHALEVIPEARRRGVASRLTRAAARWAAERGGETLALAVTEANAAARALYAGMGMREVARYHYRAAPDPPAVPLPERNR